MKVNLVELYIQEVNRLLPEKSRANIALELRSTIEDMLPEEYSERDIKAVLEKLGSPAALAGGYRDQPMHLIGPRYYTIYVMLLKMILPISTMIAGITMIAAYFIGYSEGEDIVKVVTSVILEGISTVIAVGIQVFFWLTLIFAILERTDKGKDQTPLSTSFEKWTPDDLKYIPYIPKKKAISKYEVFGSFLWTAIWVSLYFYADRLIGVYEGSGSAVNFVLAINQDVLLSFWPIVLVVVLLELGLALYKMIKGQWTKKTALFNAIFEVIATIVFLVIITNPNFMNQAFSAYMGDLFTISEKQFEGWLIGSTVIIYLISAAVSIFNGIQKARIR